MIDQLSADALFAHVTALADGIGPRPPGHPAEEQARDHIRAALHDLGLGDDIETIPFHTSDTWGYLFLMPLLLALGGNLLGNQRLDDASRVRRGRLAALLGAAASLAAAYGLRQGWSGNRQPFKPLYPAQRPTATLVRRIPPAGEPRHKLVLIGHTDTNKHRLTFAPLLKGQMKQLTTSGLATVALNAVAQFAQVLGAGNWAEKLRRQTVQSMLLSSGLLLVDELGGFVDGANDNATAVACLLGLAGQLTVTPLQHTEVWLAFTGAEEVGSLGTHALLDHYGDALRDAWFLDFELVGAGEIVYVTQHGISQFTQYAPDAESVAWAAETARQHPEFGVQGVDMPIVEEVGALRGRGYRGLCLAGRGADGLPVNWHRYDDNAANIEPETLEQAARFAWAMLQTLDAR